MNNICLRNGVLFTRIIMPEPAAFIQAALRGVARQFRGCGARHIPVGTIIATNVNH